MEKYVYYITILLLIPVFFSKFLQVPATHACIPLAEAGRLPTTLVVFRFNVSGRSWPEWDKRWVWWGLAEDPGRRRDSRAGSHRGLDTLTISSSPSERW